MLALTEHWNRLGERFRKSSAQGRICHAIMVRVGIPHDEDQSWWELLRLGSGIPGEQRYFHNLTAGKNSLCSCYFGQWNTEDFSNTVDNALEAEKLLGQTHPWPERPEWVLYLYWLVWTSYKPLPYDINSFSFTDSDFPTDLKPFQSAEDFSRLLRQECKILPGRYFLMLSHDVGRCSEAAITELIADTKANADSSQATETVSDSLPPKKPKRSTTKGEAEAKLVAALTMHHKYADGVCLNQEPIACNELARLADVSVSTASVFFRKYFNGHTKYRAICGDITQLVFTLKLQNQEVVSHHLFGAKPPGEDGHDNED